MLLFLYVPTSRLSSPHCLFCWCRGDARAPAHHRLFLMYYSHRCLPQYPLLKKLRCLLKSSLFITRCFFSLPSSHHARSSSSSMARRLRDGERGPGLLEVALLALEPTLVTGLQLHGVQGAVGDGRRDQLVAPALVTVGGAGEHLEVVVRLALVDLGEHVEHGGLGHLVGGEPPLGAGLAGVHLLAQQVPHLLQVRLRGAVVLHLGLAALGLNQDADVGHLVEVVLEVDHLVGEGALAGGVVLGGEEESVAIASIGDEAGGVGVGPPDVGGLAVRGE
mmetsp:Transcript_4872/g.12376  ORF Transcript_4872/g.12376 Transcript_4872/m.12376 type:complete len:277 (+) Transcript_4872:54-884(+)